MRELKAYSARRDVDFGKGIGTKPVYLLYVLPPLLPVYVSTKEIPTSICASPAEGAPLHLFDAQFSSF